MFDIAIRAHGFVATGCEASAEQRRAEQRRALAARRVAAAGHADGEHGGGAQGGGAQGGGGNAGGGGRAPAGPGFQMGQEPEVEEPGAGVAPPAATAGTVQRSYAASRTLQPGPEAEAEAGIDMLG